MIRVIQRRLIIPRGDTGTFTVPALSPGATGSVGVFTIFDPITKIRVFQKKVDLDGDVFNIEFSHGDTVNLQAGDYLWDIKFYKDPVIENGKVISGTEIDSYYAAFQTPKCEIRETGDDFMAIEGTPVKVEDLNIILAATQAANAAKIAAEASATEAAEKLEQMVAAIPTKISDLVDDSGHYTKPAEGIPATDFDAGAQTAIRRAISAYQKPVNGIPASDLAETYLTEHQNLSNYVQKTDYASSAKAGIVIAAAGYGTAINGNGIISVSPATSKQIKSGTMDFKPIIPNTQHEATFYGLAKAAGSDEKNSTLPLGQYTDAAKAAIQAMLDVPSTADIPTNVSELTNDAGYLTQHQDVSGFATKADTVLETTLSRGRLENSEVGEGSFAFGSNIIASGYLSHAEGNMSEANGNFSHSEGQRSKANGSQSHAEGLGSIANGASSHVHGKYNVEDNINDYPEWVSGTTYIVGDKIKRTIIENNETHVVGYICRVANSDSVFSAAKWSSSTEMHFVSIVGNGTSSNRSNAYALSWTGDGKYAGDVYINCNTDSSGGTKVLSVADFATDLDIQNIINGGAGA